MSILIKGIRMPPCCAECWAMDDYGDYPRCRITNDQRGYSFPVTEQIMDDCPLRPAPEREYERGEFDVLDLLSSAWHGKQYYFMQDNGIVYSRDSRKYMRLDDAISEFASRIGDDGSI